MRTTLTQRMLWIVLIFCCSLENQAQYTFCKQNGITDVFQDLVQTSDGGYVLGGTVASPQGNDSEFHFMKTDAAGNVLWTRTIGGANPEVGYDIIESADKGLVMVGVTGSFGMGNYDVYVVKLDSLGAVLWTRTVGGTQADEGFSIVQTFDGGYAIAGDTKSFGAGDADTYIIKLDAAGNLLWTKTVGGIYADSNLAGTSLTQASDSGLVIAGSTMSFDTQSYDIYVIKLDKNGTILWTRSVGGAQIDESKAIVETPDLAYIIAGRTLSFGGVAFYLLKFSSTGNLLWTKTIDAGAGDDCMDMCNTSDKGFAMIGRTDAFGSYYDAYVVKLDSLGSFMWSRAVGSTDSLVTVEPTALISTRDGGYAFSGGTRDFITGPTSMRGYFAKLDMNGNGCCVIAENTGTLGTGGGLLLTGGVAATGGSVSSGGISASLGSLSTICIVTTTFTGLGETQHLSELLVAPNPFSDQTQLHSERNLNGASLLVCNYLGQTVRELKGISGNTIVIQREGLSNGIYVLKLMEGENVLCTKKIIVSD